MDGVSIFQWLGVMVENMTNAFVLAGAQNLMDSIKPLVITGVTIYIMAQGYLQIAGKTDDLAIDVVKNCVAVTCITTLTLNIGNYTTYLVGGVFALGDGLASGIIPNAHTNNIYQTLDLTLEKGLELSLVWFAKVGVNPTTWIFGFCGLVILTAIAILTVRASIIILGTKFLLAMLLVVGPVFITMACFPLTRKYLDNWVSKIFENTLVQLFGISVVFMAIKAVDHYVGSVSNADLNPVALSLQIAILTALLYFVITQIPNLAGSLAGGFASAMLALPKVSPKPDQRQPNSPDRITNRETWAQQQQNQISGGSVKTGASSKQDISQDLRERIQAHNMQNR